VAYRSDFDTEDFKDFFKNRYVKFPNCLVRVIDRKLSLPAQSCIRVIIDQTIAWGRMDRKIPVSTFKEFTGISCHKTINKAIKELKDKDLISVKENGRYSPKNYGLRLATFRRAEQLKSFDIP